MSNVSYEWDEANRRNQRKHKVSFELAKLVFEDELRIIGLNRTDETGEQRWHAIGSLSTESASSVVLLVAFTFREDSFGEEIIRIISARKAEKGEIRRYQKQAMD
ncbi:MAG: BrnT family toxin [Bryobacteraceae bacterium]|jgi:uncharacterized DUF497 family protein